MTKTIEIIVGDSGYAIVITNGGDPAYEQNNKKYFVSNLGQLTDKLFEILGAKE